MGCPRCQHDNPADAAFCQECGARLEAACPGCGTANPLAAKFCKRCGQPIGSVGARGRDPAAKVDPPSTYTPSHLAEKILTGKATLEGERKQVTVLFADLRGSMELLADRDPEDARKLLDPLLERMMEAVHHYEGTVNQVMGDGIMALFGAPLAHEDHAVRACYAALRMQESARKYADEVRRSHGVVVKIRVGLNSGEVVVRAIGSDLHMDYTAVGQTTHLAARMEQIADPGAIVISPATLALAEGYVAVTSLGPVPVKGLPEPVDVYEVTGAGPARTRLQVAARRGLTRFVGRDLELEQLRRVQQLVEDGHGQVAAIVGEAGVGKSRLVYEFTHSHRLQGWLVLESASVSYGKATSYLPVIDLLRGYFKIQDRDDPREIRAKVTGRALTLDRALEPVLPALLALLDVPVDDAAWRAHDPAQRRQRTLDAVRRLLLREAREQPVLLIFEDLHWIDGETQALLDGLVDGLSSTRMLLLVNYRPDYSHAWGSKTHYSQMRLDALPAQSTQELLEALLGEDPGLAPLKQLLLRRGNPFFLEETVQTLVETKALAGERGQYRLTQPVPTIQIPATVQAMLAARIDRLDPDDKRVLQVASVVGKDVPFPLLKAIAGLADEALHGRLARLQAAEFVYEAGLYPDPEYSFKHALTHDVAYAGLLQSRRRELHARIVDAIETLHRDRLGEYTDQLAHHASRGELGERAIRYLRAAGLKAAARSALQDARGWLEQALAILDVLPLDRSTLEQACDIRLDLRPVLNNLGESWRALERTREAEALAEQLDDDGRRGRVCGFLTNAHSMLGELDEALATAARALEIAGRLGDLKLRVFSTTYLAQAHYYRGDFERVVELATDNIAAVPAEWTYQSSGARTPSSIWDRCWLVMSLAELGRFDEAASYAAEAIRLAEPTHRAFSVGQAHRAASALRLLKGDWTQARTLIERWVAVIRTGDDVMNLPWALSSSAWTLAQVGDTSEALERIRQGEELLERQTARRIIGHVSWSYHALGQACLLLGQLDEARRLGTRAADTSPRQRGFAAHAQHLLGEVASHHDRFDAEGGEVHYRRALAIATPLGMRPLAAHCHLGLARLYRQSGRQEAQTHLRTAQTMYREMDVGVWLNAVEAEARLHGPARGAE